MTDTSNPPDNDSNKPTDEISPEESADEEQYDDPDYMTASYMEFVKNPPTAVRGQRCVRKTQG
jgi:hypothetical protein